MPGRRRAAHGAHAARPATRRVLGVAIEQRIEHSLPVDRVRVGRPAEDALEPCAELRRRVRLELRAEQARVARRGRGLGRPGGLAVRRARGDDAGARRQQRGHARGRQRRGDRGRGGLGLQLLVVPQVERLEQRQRAERAERQRALAVAQVVGEGDEAVQPRREGGRQRAQRVAAHVERLERAECAEWRQLTEPVAREVERDQEAEREHRRRKNGERTGGEDQEGG